MRYFAEIIIEFEAEDEMGVSVTDIESGLVQAVYDLCPDSYNVYSNIARYEALGG